jgi:hypothetical protein
VECLDTWKHGDIHGPSKLDTGWVPAIASGEHPFHQQAIPGPISWPCPGKAGAEITTRAGFFDTMFISAAIRQNIKWEKDHYR